MRRFAPTRDELSPYALLMLPELLPCTRKVIWLDVNSMVLRKLEPLWQVRSDTPCGIAARPSIARSPTGKFAKNPADRTDGIFETSIASEYAILLIDLDKVRATQFSSVVEDCATRHGKSAIIPIHAYCNGIFTKLPSYWSMYHFDDEQQHDHAFDRYGFKEWSIVTWRAGTKPFVGDDGKGVSSRLRRLRKKFRTTTVEALSQQWCI